jgi:hypothetical protein
MRTDAKHHGLNSTAHHGSHNGLEHIAGHHNPEAFTTPWPIEEAHGEGPHWESLWIDLGGEG